MLEIAMNPAAWSEPALVLAGIAWQSAALLALGLVASLLLARRPARAHRVLLLAMAAAVVAPLATQLVRVEGWGLWTLAAPESPRVEAAPVVEATATVPAAAAAPLGPIVPQPVRPAVPIAAATAVPTIQEPDRLGASLSLSPAAVIWCAWGVLSACFLARLAMATVATRRAVAAAAPIAGDEWTRVASTAATRMGLSDSPEVRASTRVLCPSIWCWGRRPVIHLPATGRQSEASVDWVGVFCHELAHRVRADHWSSLFAEVFLALVPWNPLAWWARHRLAELSELACDDWALAAGVAADDYAESLLGLVPQRRAALALSAVSNHRGLIGRVRHILADRHVMPAVGRAWGIASAAIVTLTVSAVALAQSRPASEQSPAHQEAAAASGKAESQQPAPHREIKGVILQPDGRPAAGTRVYWIGEPKGQLTRSTMPKGQRDRLGMAPELVAETRADDSGRFDIAAAFNPDRYFHEEGAAAQLVVAFSAVGLLSESIPDDATEVKLQLTPQVMIRGRLLTPGGTPAAGVRVALQSFHDDSLRHAMGVQALLPDDRVPAYWPRPVTTGSDGRFTLEGVPEGTYAQLEFRHGDYATDEVTVNAVTRGGIKAMLTAMAKAFDVAPVKPDFTHTLEPARPVVGRVTDKATGKPLAGLVVELIPMRSHGGQSFFTRTDSDGRYRIAGHQADQYITTVYPDPESGYLSVKDWHRGWPAGAKELVKDFALTRGRVVRGLVIDAGTNRPIAGASVIYQPKRGNPNNNDQLELRNPTLTGRDGRFAITTLPGAGILAVETTDPTYMRKQLDGDSGPRSHAFPQGSTSIDLPKDGEPPTVEIRVRKGVTLQVRVLDPGGKPARGVIGTTEGIDAKLMDVWNQGQPFVSGVFRLEGADPDRTYRVYLLHPGFKLGGFLDVKPDPKGGLAGEVRLQPTARVRGKVVAASGSPAPGAQVYPALAGEAKAGKMSRIDMMMSQQELPYFNLLGQMAMMPYWSRMNAGREGEFTIDTLIPGLRLSVNAFARPRGEAMVPVAPLKPGEDRDLGTIKVEEIKE